MQASRPGPARSRKRATFSLTVAAAVAAVVVASSAWAPFAGAAPPTGAPPHGKLQLNESAGEMQGTFVSFKTPSADNILEDFVSNGTSFFDAVSASGYEKRDAMIEGAQLKIHGSNVDTQVHDNPNALIKFTVDNGTTIAFDLNAGLTASWARNNSAFNISLNGSNRTAVVWWTCNNTSGALGGAHSFEVAAGATCHVFFRSHIDNPSAEASISEAAETGFLMAEVRVGGAGETAEVAAYGDTSVVVARGVEGISVSMGPEGPRPSSVVVRFVPDGGSSPLVFVDGRAVRQADGLVDSLDPTDDGQDIEYSFTPIDDGTTVLVVSVPDAASHVVQIKAESITAPPARDLSAAVAGIAAAILITAGAALVLFRRR